MGLRSFIKEAKRELGPTPPGTDWLTGQKRPTRPQRTLIGRREMAEACDCPGSRCTDPRHRGLFG